MNIKKYILLFLIIPTTIFSSGGSIYSRYGLGDLYYSYSARRLAMGELGAAIIDSRDLSYYNPASWYNIKLTRFETGLNFTGLNLKDNINNSFFNQTEFSGFTFGFPVDRDYGIVVVGGLLPYSTVTYEVIDNVESSDNDYTSNYNGTGGLTRLFIGTTYELPFNFVLGAAYEFYTGKIDYNSSLDFQSNLQLTDPSYRKRYNFNGIGTSIGLLSSDLSDIFSTEKIKDLRFGITFNYIAKINTDTTLTKSSALGTAELTSGETKTKIPYRFGIGTSIRWDEDYLIIFDYLYQPWSEFEFNGVKSDNLRDLQKISGGIEYGKQDVRFGSFWEQIRIRGGLSFEQSQYEINGKGINQYAIYGGISLPLSSTNSLNFGVQYGFRGTTESNLVKENFFNANVTISFGEIWFVREER